VCGGLKLPFSSLPYSLWIICSYVFMMLLAKTWTK
jgi:hypothetical protein